MNLEEGWTTMRDKITTWGRPLVILAVIAGIGLGTGYAGFQFADSRTKAAEKAAQREAFLTRLEQVEPALAAWVQIYQRQMAQQEQQRLAQANPTPTTTTTTLP